MTSKPLYYRLYERNCGSNWLWMELCEAMYVISTHSYKEILKKGWCRRACQIISTLWCGGQFEEETAVSFNLIVPFIKPFPPFKRLESKQSTGCKIKGCDHVYIDWIASFEDENFPIWQCLKLFSKSPFFQVSTFDKIAHFNSEVFSEISLRREMFY